MKFYAKINISLFGLASKRAYLESRGDNDYVKVSIFPDFVDNFPIFLQFPFTIYFPILCKLYNLTLWNHNFKDLLYDVIRLKIEPKRYDTIGYSG